ncbi:pleckstrin homology domain-containing family M member 1 isoform X2 [Cynoglossus semilaevis]|uniref:Pleckstrin homology domain containing, family M (with RUN domain) member 1 n=1 Tax=Cynoglossus semilaevis TaxID=244447 RepID=A0A3P8VFQ7_CYNSE|nr:pleckstrin homology domain-containing family M member 1 isoform X2 [Cynoglossus semilaevis]
MLATQIPDMPPEAKDVRQIKETLAQSLKALQKRYVTSDSVVTSEDGDANLLCCALEAIFIHGIRSKYIRTEAAGRARKGNRGPLPQPFFWSLLKSITHRDVIMELEKISFVGTDVGRCRAWLRLALNHGLLECYLVSLFREDSKLRTHYQPSALLLNTEEREVLLSYLQGLASLQFSLSYKSSVLNEWTTTPLVLAGLCPLYQADSPSVSHNGRDYLTSTHLRKESWDTVSQSSGSSDFLDTQTGCPVLTGKESSAIQDARTALNSSNLSLETTGSSQLSSSLSSDSLLQGQDPHSSTEQWSSCDLDLPVNGNISTRQQKDSLTGESGQCSQDSLREDSFVSSMGPDQFSDTAVLSGSDSDIQASASLTHDLKDRPPKTVLWESQPPTAADDVPLCAENHVNYIPSDVCKNISVELKVDMPTISDPVETVEAGSAGDVQETFESVQEQTQTSAAATLKNSSSQPLLHPGEQHFISVVSRKQSTDSLTHSPSWISDDDIYKPQLEVVSDHDKALLSVPTPEPEVSQTPPSVIHRRQIGLSNPFRGLLKLGHLERRGALAMWHDYYCELSPFEFRLYSNAEERTCCENCYLVRCEDAQVTSSEGRFELAFPGKRLYLRAANQDEAEDWVDRILEAVNKCRPASHMDEQWEVLRPTTENGADECTFSSPSSAPSSPEKGVSTSDSRTGVGPEAASLSVQEFDWTRTGDIETDAIKEAVLYFSTDADTRTWTPLVFSLSLETLKGFRVQDGRKFVHLTYPIEEIRDVVPDVSSGGPDFFKLLTVNKTLRLRAENPEEARSWRVSIRGALDAYLESGEGCCDDPAAVHQGVSGNLHRLVQHRLKEDASLLVHLCTVPSEKGLDTQNFKCAGCPQQIGPSLGRARLCEFSGQHYCESCHHGDATIIPSRMVHNWDLTQREVSRKALQLLAKIEQEPLLDLGQLNPGLLNHAESMALVHNLRQRLRLLGDYILTCRSKAYKKLQSRMGQRLYLLESSHLYSVMDLRQIAEGQFATHLMTLLQFASNHVFQCDLCTQRGFICQICHANDTIFPFQFDSTTRCKECKAVFHRACKTPGLGCPRCQRMKKYQERDCQD